MVEVPAGPFRMGAQAADPAAPGYDPAAHPDEGPVREVTVSRFFLDVHPVTVAEFTDCVRDGACSLSEVAQGGYMNYGRPERRDHPMNGVTWGGARDHCRWIGARLPTEAEWEKAARGREGRRFSWGDEEADCSVRSAGWNEGCPSDGTTLAGNHQISSPYGVKGLSGHVFEWVEDGYLEDAYARLPGIDPVGPAEAPRKVQRGGSWQSRDPMERRAAFRAALPPGEKMADVGFRCARDGADPLGPASHVEARAVLR